MPIPPGMTFTLPKAHCPGSSPSLRVCRHSRWPAWLLLALCPPSCIYLQPLFSDAQRASPAASSPPGFLRLWAVALAPLYFGFQCSGTLRLQDSGHRNRPPHPQEEPLSRPLALGTAGPTAAEQGPFRLLNWLPFTVGSPSSLPPASHPFRFLPIQTAVPPVRLSHHTPPSRACFLPSLPPQAAGSHKDTLSKVVTGSDMGGVWAPETAAKLPLVTCH